MTSRIGARRSCLPLPDAEGRATRMRTACLAGATAMALALALPAAAQDTQTMEPDTRPAAEGMGETTSPPAGMPEGGDAAGIAGTEAETDAETDAGTAGLAAKAEPGEGAGHPVPFEGQIIAQEDGTFAISDLVGAEVSGADGARIGKVRDVLLSDDHRLEGILVAVGGFLGFGEKLIGIDIARAQMVATDGGARSVVLDLDTAELERAPDFVSLETQRRLAEEAAARQAAEQALQDATRGTSVPAQ